MSIIVQIKEKAKTLGNKIVLPEATDERVIRAAAGVVEEKLGTPVLVGNVETIKTFAANLGVSLDGVEIIDPKTTDKLASYVEKLCELRAKKG